MCSSDLDLGNAADSDPLIINTLSAIQSATQAAQASAKQGLAKVTKLTMYKTIPGFTPSTSAYMDKLEAMSKLVGTDDSVTLEDMKRVQALAASVNTVLCDSLVSSTYLTYIRTQRLQAIVTGPHCTVAGDCNPRLLS